MMTISDATPHNSTKSSTEEIAADPLGTVNSVHFTLGPEVTPGEAMEKATTTVAFILPSLLADRPESPRVCAEVQAVLAELVDVTARHRAGSDLVGGVVYDGQHVTVSVGDMDRKMPTPEVEPGLYLVYRFASEVGQYAGDHGGRVTWAAVPT